MLSDASLAPIIRQQITAPPSPERLPWKMLPSLDAKAIAYKNRLEELRKERDRNLAEAERLRAQRGVGSASSFKLPGHNDTTGKLDGAINFSAGSNSSFLGNVTHGDSSSSGGGFDFSGVSGGGHRRRTATTGGEAPKKRRAGSVDANFIAGNLQVDFFNHDK